MTTNWLGTCYYLWGFSWSLSYAIISYTSSRSFHPSSCSSSVVSRFNFVGEPDLWEIPAKSESCCEMLLSYLTSFLLCSTLDKVAIDKGSSLFYFLRLTMPLLTVEYSSLSKFLRVGGGFFISCLLLPKCFITDGVMDPLKGSKISSAVSFSLENYYYFKPRLEDPISLVRLLSGDKFACFI